MSKSGMTKEELEQRLRDIEEEKRHVLAELRSIEISNRGDYGEL